MMFGMSPPLMRLYSIQDERLFKKTLAVIYSCKTHDQLLAAGKYKELAKEKSFIKAVFHPHIEEAFSARWRTLSIQKSAEELVQDIKRKTHERNM